MENHPAMFENTKQFCVSVSTSSTPAPKSIKGRVPLNAVRPELLANKDDLGTRNAPRKCGGEHPSAIFGLNPTWLVVSTNLPLVGNILLILMVNMVIICLMMANNLVGGFSPPL